ncbi:MAG: sensor histidine kinase [Lachnospiraceae bacterium]|nr:sensor histidine kinase [Lachnospiraceae bacterium]
MEQILDKCMLLGFGIIFLIGGESIMMPVVALLTAIISAALGFYIEDKKIMYILFVGIFIMALLQPMVLLFFPVYLYDAVYRKMSWFLAFFLAAPLVPPVLHGQKEWILWVFSIMLSVVLANKTIKKQSLMEELIRTRDDSTELNLMLKEKNKNLLEKQDYEIYLATLRERNRIAREIHDNVGHMLSRSLLMTGALLTIEKEGMVHEQLVNIKDTLDTAMTNIRQSVHDLHDDSVDLKQSIIEIVETIQSDYDVRLDYDMSIQVPRKVKYCLIATTKEAVSNIIKHSNGDKVQISLREHPGFYQLVIEDNGTNAHIGSGNGIGLQNMKERADSLGGTFRIHTEKGFGIFLTIPKTEEILCE